MKDADSFYGNLLSPCKRIGRAEQGTFDAVASRGAIWKDPSAQQIVRT